LRLHLLVDFFSIERIAAFANAFYCQTRLTANLSLEFEAKLLQQNSGQLLEKHFIKLQEQHQRQHLLVSKHAQVEYPWLPAGRHL